MFKNLSLLKFGKLRKKMQNPSKRKALDFLSSGGDPEAQTGAQAAKRSPKINKDPLISTLSSKNKTTAIEILDFFGSKRTEERLRGSVKRLRNSLVNTFDIAAILKSVIIGITKQLESAPSKLKGKGGAGGGLLGFLKDGIIKLVGGLGAKILGILGGIISLLPMMAGFVMPALVLGGITFAVTNEDFRDKIKNMLPGSSTDDAVDEQIEQQGGSATAEALRKEQAEKRASRNPFQNFFHGTIMGEDAEYDKQIARAETSASSGSTGTSSSSSLSSSSIRSRTPVLPGARAQGTGTEGDPVVEGEDREYLIKLMLAEAGGEGELGMAAVGRSVLNRAGLIQSGQVTPGTFNARSGSIKDVIQGRHQYQPYAEGKLDKTYSAADMARGEKALQVAESRARLRRNLLQSGQSERNARLVGASTGFRTHAARYDASQEVNVVELGGHRFNTAGNEGLKLPTIRVIPPPQPPAPKPESLVEGENVSADTSRTRTQEIAREDNVGSVGNIAVLPVPMGSGRAEPYRNAGGSSIFNPSSRTGDAGGSPTVAHLPSKDDDSLEYGTSMSIYQALNA